MPLAEEQEAIINRVLAIWGRNVSTIAKARQIYEAKVETPIEVILSKYRKFVMKLHPDKCFLPFTKDAFIAVQQAKEELERVKKAVPLPGYRQQQSSTQPAQPRPQPAAAPPQPPHAPPQPQAPARPVPSASTVRPAPPSSGGLASAKKHSSQPSSAAANAKRSMPFVPQSTGAAAKKAKADPASTKPATSNGGSSSSAPPQAPTAAPAAKPPAAAAAPSAKRKYDRDALPTESSTLSETQRREVYERALELRSLGCAVPEALHGWQLEVRLRANSGAAGKGPGKDLYATSPNGTVYRSGLQLAAVLQIEVAAPKAKVSTTVPISKSKPMRASASLGAEAARAADAGLHGNGNGVAASGEEPIQIVDEEDDEAPEREEGVEYEDEESREWKGELVGKRVAVWWDGDEEWFKGVVSKFTIKHGANKFPNGRAHSIKYDDKTNKVHCLLVDRWRLLEPFVPPDPAEPIDVDADAPAMPAAAAVKPAGSSTAAAASKSAAMQRVRPEGHALTGRSVEAVVGGRRQQGLVEGFNDETGKYAVMWGGEQQMFLSLAGDDLEVTGLRVLDEVAPAAPVEQPPSVAAADEAAAVMPADEAEAPQNAQAAQAAEVAAEAPLGDAGVADAAMQVDELGAPPQHETAAEVAATTTDVLGKAQEVSESEAPAEAPADDELAASVMDIPKEDGHARAEVAASIAPSPSQFLVDDIEAAQEQLPDAPIAVQESAFAGVDPPVAMAFPVEEEDDEAVHALEPSQTLIPSAGAASSAWLQAEKAKMPVDVAEAEDEPAQTLLPSASEELAPSPAPEPSPAPAAEVSAPKPLSSGKRGSSIANWRTNKAKTPKPPPPAADAPPAAADAPPVATEDTPTVASGYLAHAPSVAQDAPVAADPAENVAGGPSPVVLDAVETARRITAERAERSSKEAGSTTNATTAPAAASGSDKMAAADVLKAKARPTATTGQRTPKTDSSAASRVAASPPSKATEPAATDTSAPSAGLSLVRWQCVNGVERWAMTERSGDDADFPDEASEDEPSIHSRAGLQEKYGDKRAEQMVRSWEKSANIMGSVASMKGTESEVWVSMLQAAAQADANAPNLAACCRLLLLLETAVLSEEMQKIPKGKKWEVVRSNWCKSLRNLFASGAPAGDTGAPGVSSAVGALVHDTLFFASGINREKALTPAFAACFDEWVAELQTLGTAADGASVPQTDRGRRPSRVPVAPGKADAALAGTQMKKWRDLVHQLCDGIGRWHSCFAADSSSGAEDVN